MCNLGPLFAHVTFSKISRVPGREELRTDQKLCVCVHDRGNEARPGSSSSQPPPQVQQHALHNESGVLRRLGDLPLRSNIRKRKRCRQMRSGTDRGSNTPPVSAKKITFMRTRSVLKSLPAGPGFTVKRPIKDLYAFSGRCTKFRYSCSARQNTYEFFLHEYVNFVHGREKPYRSLSTKIYIFMQCAPKSYGGFSSLRADAGI